MDWILLAALLLVAMYAFAEYGDRLVELIKKAKKHRDNIKKEMKK